MAEVKPFKDRDRLEKDKLLEFCKMLIEEGDFIVLISHRDEANVTDLATNLNFSADRIGIKGILVEAQEIINRLCPVKVYEGDGEE